MLPWAACSAAAPQGHGGRDVPAGRAGRAVPGTADGRTGTADGRTAGRGEAVRAECGRALRAGRGAVKGPGLGGRWSADTTEIQLPASDELQVKSIGPSVN